MGNLEKLKLNVVFVGHVDHGKSTLIGRLLFDTDSLPKEKISEVKKICEDQGRPFEFAFLMDHMQEERDQNITIDTAQIFFKTKKREYVIIDAPGHREFIKNMITGASQAEAAILIVDAAEGIQEQTRRHAKFLNLLGLSQVIVVINKMDKVEYKKDIFEKVKNELSQFLNKIDINPQFIIPISAQEGENVAKQSEKMPWYQGKTAIEALDKFKSRADQTTKPLRFPVQDLYKFDDKRIVAGQLASGVMKVGDQIIFSPKNSKTKVKSIEKFISQADQSQAGESIGITLKDPVFIDRGDIASHLDSAPDPSKQIRGSLFWMSKEPLKISDSLELQCSTQEVGVNIIEISNRINSSSLNIIDKVAKELSETEIASVTLEAEEPIIIENFNNIPELGRFTLIRSGEVVAGGIISK